MNEVLGNLLAYPARQALCAVANPVALGGILGSITIVTAGDRGPDKAPAGCVLALGLTALPLFNIGIHRGTTVFLHSDTITRALAKGAADIAITAGSVGMGYVMGLAVFFLGSAIIASEKRDTSQPVNFTRAELLIFGPSTLTRMAATASISYFLTTLLERQ